MGEVLAVMIVICLILYGFYSIFSNTKEKGLGSTIWWLIAAFILVLFF